MRFIALTGLSGLTGKLHQMDSVQIIRSESEAKVLIDPIRREILRLLAAEPMSGTGLAKALGLSPPSVSHQLAALKKGGFVSVYRRVEGNHGIVQKFYRPSAQVYVTDKRTLPLSIVRYFTPYHVERTRGIVVALSLLQEGFKLSSRDLEKTAWDFSSCLVEAAHKYPGISTHEDPEFLVSRLYRHALDELVRSNPAIFPKIP